MLTTPRVKKEKRSNSILISNNGIDFKDTITLFTKEGKSYPMAVSSTVKKSIQLEVPDVVGISSDKFDYVVLLTNKEGIISVEQSRLAGGVKQLITLDADEYVTEVIPVKGDSFEYGKVEYQVDWYLRVKVSKPKRNWRV